MEKYCYLNGKILETQKAKISITDIGILRGFGVFEGLRTYNGKPFLFSEHFSRLQRSARLIGLEFPLKKAETRAIIEKLAQKNKVNETSVRIVLTGGDSPDGTSYDSSHPTFYILLHTHKPFDPRLYKNGAKLITIDYGREIPEAKTNNYITKLKNDATRNRAKAHEILYIEDGYVLEGATCNMFMFKGDILVTPKDNILIGTRRELTLRLARKSFNTEEREVKLYELLGADEAFITSCNRGIMPVTQVDGKKIGKGHVGENTKALMALYERYVEKNK